VTVDRRRGEARIDFTGTDAISDGNLNAPRSVVRAVVLYVLRTLIRENIPLNAGCLVPIELVVPPASLLDPIAPAAVAGGNVETSQCIADALLAALGAAAASQGTMNNLTFGDAQHQYYETICGGCGAGPGFNGASAVHSHMTNSRLTDIEVLEQRFPVRVRRFAIRRGSGGAGRWQGGAGVIREIEFLAPMRLSLLASRRRVAPFGICGGGAGATGRDTVIRRDGRREPLPPGAEVAMLPGDRILIETPGGGGYGKNDAVR
jgi:5-oxoprolinase (ATP-hydrolysing)